MVASEKFRVAILMSYPRVSLSSRCCCTLHFLNYLHVAYSFTQSDPLQAYTPSTKTLMNNYLTGCLLIGLEGHRHLLSSYTLAQSVMRCLPLLCLFFLF